MRFIRVDPPEPLPGTAVVDVRAVSINRGELHRLDAARAGWRPGWDFAGVVAAVGAGVDDVTPGDRVVGLLPEGAWAETVVASTSNIAQVGPLTLTDAAALPVAGVTAMRLVRLAGRDLHGASVLVVGAAGGVGRVAVQLAAATGAHVTAAVGHPQRAAGLRQLGAAEVATLEQLPGPFEVILESVGGQTLTAAFQRLAQGGTLVAFGNSSREATTFNMSDLYPKQVSIRCFHLLEDLPHNPPASDLQRLVDLSSSRRLKIDVAAVLPWEQHHYALDLLRSRAAAGKVVLSVSGTPNRQRHNEQLRCR